MTATGVRRRLLVVGAALAALVAVVAANSTVWIGRTFPGFFLMANRVVPSIALPDWEAARSATLFQHQIVALDDVAVATAEEVYARVAASTPGTFHAYRMRAPDGTFATVTAAARRFSGRDYALLFGAYLSTGVAFFLTGLVVVWLKRSAASRALLVQSLTTGLFVVTAADLYGPHWFFRVHVVAEAMLAAGFIHLAMVFPTDRLGDARRAALLTAIYAPFVALAAAYQWALASPSAYTTLHLIASASHGVGALTIIGVVVYDFMTTRSPLVRRRIGVVGLGTLGAFALPGALMAASALLGGQVSLNAGAFTAFVFPLSLGYAIVKQDLFEIDVMLRRAVIYAGALVAITAGYLATLAALSALVPLQSLSPPTLALLNLGILLLMAPVKARAQAVVDRLFYRKAYDPERALSTLSQALSSARSLAEVEAHTLAILTDTVHPTTATLWLTEDGVQFTCVAPAARQGATVVLPAAPATRLGKGAVVSRWAGDGARGDGPAFWRTLDAEIVVPIRSGASVLGALALGRKESGRSWTEPDSVFLAAAANQIGLAITNARAFERLAALNASLEDQIRERTAALEVANRDLNRSYTAMQSAFRQLEQSQASLIRADRLATLGRLAASVAHEVNTPLGAVLNALQTLRDLGREYEESIGDAEVSPDDHREIAREILATADAAAGWARKAATFITRVKSHGREPHPAWRQLFTVRTVVEETRALLAQRLRLECCELAYEEDPADVTLVGDPARLGQVLVNLVNNALDAYEEARSAESRVVVRARRTGDTVEIAVRDWAGGMPDEVAARIFDELFTTKDPGRGTGLGLCIARNLVEQSFGGTLRVETEHGVGSRFVLTLPANAAAEVRPVDAA